MRGAAVLIDVVSDLHFDFYPAPAPSFAQTIVPKKPSEVLVIAGDLGHSNVQNAHLVRALRETGGYGRALVVSGNHDMYLDPKSRQYEDSWERLAEMRELLQQIPSVQVLDGERLELEGVRFCGLGMWYDMSFGLGRGYFKEELVSLWHRLNNDSRYIRWGETGMDAFMAEQRQKLQAAAGEVDVMITHVGPDWRRASPQYLQDPTTSFFFFDGEEEVRRMRGTWIFGHTHDRSDAQVGACRLLNAALGYPWEIGDRRIMTIAVEGRTDGAGY